MSELKADELEHIAYMQTLEIQSLNARIAELSQAVGLITTLKPTMVMDANHPLDMAKEVVEYVNTRITELEAEVTKCHELQDSYCDRIAELEGLVDKLIEAGDAMCSAYPMWIPVEDDWEALVADWKEREE